MKSAILLFVGLVLSISPARSEEKKVLPFCGTYKEVMDYLGEDKVPVEMGEKASRFFEPFAFPDGTFVIVRIFGFSFLSERRACAPRWETNLEKLEVN